MPSTVQSTSPKLETKRSSSVASKLSPTINELETTAEDNIRPNRSNAELVFLRFASLIASLLSIFTREENNTLEKKWSKINPQIDTNQCQIAEPFQIVSENKTTNNMKSSNNRGESTLRNKVLTPLQQ